VARGKTWPSLYHSILSAGLLLNYTLCREKVSGLNQGQEEILRAKESLDQERETLNMDKKSLANLRSEHSRLKVVSSHAGFRIRIRMDPH
jgi:hypothetical protein